MSLAPVDTYEARALAGAMTDAGLDLVDVANACVASVQAYETMSVAARRAGAERVALLFAQRRHDALQLASFLTELALREG